MTDNAQFDAIVVGSGITGGWAAKQLTEAGLKVLMIERGRKIEHQVDYQTENKALQDAHELRSSWPGLTRPSTS